MMWKRELWILRVNKDEVLNEEIIRERKFISTLLGMRENYWGNV